MRRSLVPLVVLLALTAVLAQSDPKSSGTIIQATPKSEYVHPQLSPELEKDRRYSMELVSKNKFLEALPWLDKLAKAAPNDAEVLVSLAECLYAHSATLTNAGEKKAEVLRTRQLLLQAQKLGYSSDYLETLIAGIPPDAADPAFSDNAEVDRIMKHAEADFAAGNYDAAKQGYLQAILLEPNNYDAVLFMGDIYFAKRDSVAAGQWYSRAINIDPNREVAYRYWGDALAMAGKLPEARHKYIEAVVAEPYKRSSWNGINKWLQYAKQPITWYHFQSPNSHEVKGKNAEGKNDININIDSSSLNKKDGSSAWMMYEMTRALWQGDEFKKNFPNEKEYRHSLKEEFQALSVVAETADSLATGKKPEKLNADLAALVRFNKAGLLEPYILLNAADAAIARDYEGYRKDHRDVLIRYLDEVVVPPVPKTE
jgi:tetratricopeptide (TPR) repeat protein